MKFTTKYACAIVGVWTGVALFDLAGDYINAVIWEREFSWADEIPFVTSWYTWALLTPPAVFFAKKIYYSERYLPKFIAYQFVIYLGLNIVQIVLASFYVQFTSQWLNNGQPLSGVFYKTAMAGTFYNFMIYSFILLAINTFRYYRDLQQEQTRSIQLEQKLSESRMQFLKQQLQPHFLFNTHHSIITLMRLGEKQKAVEMMEKLSDLMRFALRENQSQEITVQQEIQLINLYLDIQKVRFEEKLDVRIQIAGNVNNLLLPAMVLQPLAENAIKYAVEPATGICTIWISVMKNDGYLQLEVKDNGNAGKLRDVQKGIGLRNTEERLRQLYGSNHTFTVIQEHGFMVTIKIPLHYA